MPDKGPENAVKACYSTWSSTYFDDYYGEKAAYPPVHAEIIRSVLLESDINTLLDAGCGPASFLRRMIADNVDLYGFDVTPEMVDEARRIMREFGRDERQIWEGSVLSPESFQPPLAKNRIEFDAAICVGVFPHIPEEADLQVIRNLRDCVRKGGMAIVEARNKLFSLFTLNKYSRDFFLNDLIRRDSLAIRAENEAPELERTLSDLDNMFRVDLPSVRKGSAGEPGYDEVLSRTHNPLELRDQFASAGFEEIRILFYHYHCMPPMFESRIPGLFRQESLAMEDPNDWRGYFMASAFLVVGKRV